MKKNNILFVTDHTGTKKINDIVTDIWYCNTNYSVIQCSDISNKQFKDYIKALKNSQIVVISAKDLTDNTEINDVVDFCTNFHYTPVIVIKDRHKDMGHVVYLALEELVPNTIEYTINKKNEDYEEFMNICNEYVKGTRNNDKTIQASGGRKRLSTRT